MRVVVISPGPSPEKGIPLGRIHIICKALVKNGVDVEVVVSCPRKGCRYEESEIVDGVVYRHIANNAIEGKLRFFRLINVFVCQLNVLYQVFVNRFNAQVVVVYPSFDYRLFIPIVSMLSKVKVVMEINEFPFVDRPGWFSDVKRFVMFKLFFRLYDGFIVISEELMTLVNRYRSTKSIIVKIPVLAEPASKIAGATSPYDSPYMFHAGSLTEEKDGVLGILEAFGMARKRLGINLKYVFTGEMSNSNYSNQIKFIVNKYNLNDFVFFTGFLSQEQLFRHLQFCSLAIVNKYDTIQNRYCFATKLAEYLSYSIPVVTTTVGESKYYLTDGLDAYVVEPHNPGLLAEKIIEAFNNESERLKIATGGYELFEKSFVNLRYCDRFVDFFERVVFR